jgi:hypothetical protein
VATDSDSSNIGRFFVAWRKRMPILKVVFVVNVTAIKYILYTMISSAHALLLKEKNQTAVPGAVVLAVKIF